MKVIEVVKFSDELTNRDENQRDGANNGVDFRTKFLSDLDNKDAWSDDDIYAELDFKGVIKLGPSWANEVFAYYTRYAKPQRILKKLKLEGISRVKETTIKVELEKGYRGK